jgi:hypothetical protein
MVHVRMVGLREGVDGWLVSGSGIGNRRVVAT